MSNSPSFEISFTQQKPRDCVINPWVWISRIKIKAKLSCQRLLSQFDTCPMWSSSFECFGAFTCIHKYLMIQHVLRILRRIFSKPVENFHEESGSTVVEHDGHWKYHHLSLLSAVVPKGQGSNTVAVAAYISESAMPGADLGTWIPWEPRWIPAGTALKNFQH